MTYGTSPAASSRSGSNGLAIAGMACGIIGLLFLPIVLGPLAIIFGAVGMRQAGAKGGGGMAKAGVILGVIDVIIFIVLIAVAASSGGFTWYVGG
ncbi:DUF4190 domain-containing protein [Streptomyces sp. NPDC052225]|uniref:DUF4190 domain-containing protein n=1 Tax=Streptomyces sp. NPDC052225 TaxID=3154949 RepID=UPI00343625F0